MDSSGHGGIRSHESGEVVTIWVLIALGILLVLAYVIYSRFRVTPGPQRALVYPGGGLWSGWRGTDGEDLRIVVGKTRFVPPPHRHRGELFLGIRNIELGVSCETKQALRVRVVTTVTFRVGNAVEHIRRAALRFLDSNSTQLEKTVSNLIQNTVRTVIGEFEYTALVFDQETVISEVRERVRSEFLVNGLLVESVGFNDIVDLDGHGAALRRNAEVDAELQRVQADHRLKVESAREEAEAAEKQYELSRRSQEIQLELAEIKADRARREAELANRNEQAIREERLELAALDGKRRRMEIDLKSYETQREIELAKQERIARNDTEIQLKVALSQAQTQQLLAAARAEGLKIKEQVAGLTPAQIQQQVMLILAQNMGDIAKAAKVELPQLERVIQSGGDSRGFLDTIATMGLPIAEVIGEIFKQLRDVDPAKAIGSTLPADELAAGQKQDDSGAPSGSE